MDIDRGIHRVFVDVRRNLSAGLPAESGAVPSARRDLGPVDRVSPIVGAGYPLARSPERDEQPRVGVKTRGLPRRDRPGRSATIVRMDPAPRVRVSLDVDAHAEPITGDITAPGRLSQPFIGWIALMRVVEVMLDEARSAERDRGKRDGPAGRGR